MSIQLDRATEADLPAIAAMEQEDDTKPFIVPYTIQQHLGALNDSAVIYLKIVRDQQTVGFFILALDPDEQSVEFRRVVVASVKRGVGQQAIEQMEHFCRVTLGRHRIWLDVFAHNQRGRHIYEKLGYTQFAEASHFGDQLLLYEKAL